MNRRKQLLPRVWLAAGALLLSGMLLVGCGIKKQEKTETQKLDYTVVVELEIPEELKGMIEEKKEKAFQVSFATGEELYLAVGYGEQPTGGYSVIVERLEETPEAIYFETNLMGPDKEEKVSQKASYPYIVVKTEFRDKSIYYE